MEAPDLTFRYSIPIIPRAVRQAGPAAPPVTQLQPAARPSVSSCQDSALHDHMKAAFQGMAAQIADQMLGERVDERAGAHRPPDPVEPYSPSFLGGWFVSL
ncbi:hypothetical protein [Streptomyces soliscabiei]|uniref:hypothetical protein n=1 Tax=Streptomyces soliscabiei TaxID=588897 RepID=UPI0029A08A08|nr:hypothetical protein [Streptomyces sp. NY05-11A]MDX2678150.1 hypothetical protein [Streptomyces sp. NY05-11A]